MHLEKGGGDDDDGAGGGGGRVGGRWQRGGGMASTPNLSPCLTRNGCDRSF